MTKKKKPVKVKAKRGRPSPYKPEYAEQAYMLCLLGATNEQLADFFKVATSTIDKWIAEKPEFSGTIKAGRTLADATVARSLFERARGYNHKAVKLALDRKGQWQQAEYVEHYPPETQAARLWLINRQPDLWRDKQEIDLTKTIVVQVEGEETDEEEQ